jgi:hypothetical protein
MREVDGFSSTWQAEENADWSHSFLYKSDLRWSLPIWGGGHHKRTPLLGYLLNVQPTWSLEILEFPDGEVVVQKGSHRLSFSDSDILGVFRIVLPTQSPPWCCRNLLVVVVVEVELHFKNSKHPVGVISDENYSAPVQHMSGHGIMCCREHKMPKNYLLNTWLNMHLF